MVVIGSARIDENGRARGGKPGDQTGSEVSTQQYYLHSKGWDVIRAKDEKVAHKIGSAMAAACANRHWGYNQDERDSGTKKVADYGYDPAMLSVDANTDCSALVRCCVLYAGVWVGDFYTGTEKAMLLKTGAFELVNVKLPDELRMGDILVTKSKGHTVVVISNSKLPAEEPKTWNTGWHAENGRWWYADSPTTYLADRWEVINHHWYRFDPDGWMAEGWRKIMGRWFYLQDTDGGDLRGALWHEAKEKDGALEVWTV